MKIYISIPISGKPIEIQKAKAKQAAKQICALGHEPINPFDTPEPQGELSEKEQYAYYMGEDIKRLLLCDAIYMCKGWMDSVGCQIEYNVAYQKRLYCIFSLEHLPFISENEK